MEPTTILLDHKLSAIFQAGLSFFQKANIGKDIDKHRRENMAARQEEYQRQLTRQEKQNFTHAAADGRTELLTTLLSTQQLNVNKADAAGKTALTYAIRNRHEPCVQLLLQQRGLAAHEVYAQALEAAKENKIPSAISTLLLRHLLGEQYDKTPTQDTPKVSLRDKILSGLSSMLYAAKKVYDKNNVILQWAAEHDKVMVLKLLLHTKGVNINHKGARKLTPLQLAEMKRNLVCASLLRSAGAQ